MYIIVPSIIILFSLAGIAGIIYRKLPYLRKLSPQAAHSSENHVLHDYFPELIDWFKEFKWRAYRQTALREIEKGLRRMRLVVMKVDHASDRMIKKVRKIHHATHIEQTMAAADKPENVEKIVESSIPTHPSQMAREELKTMEQKLIIEIAHDPKNTELYERLGDLYIKMESLQDAREAYEAALGFNPDNKTLIRKYSILLKK